MTIIIRAVERARRVMLHSVNTLWMAGVVCSAVGGLAPQAVALDLTPWAGRPATERVHFQGDQFHRAGDPQCVSPLAVPSQSPHGVGYYVGGGARVKGCVGEERRPNEGTWGTDYSGILLHKKIDLRWSHGRRYQGGVGAYRTDGPRLIHAP
jgi:hypothetical protein